tara:strand:+ start:237 stop:506 length:270 start_codon:yes stop_codon:yes gene_type:complete
MSKRYCKADVVEDMITKSDIADEVNRMVSEGILTKTTVIVEVKGGACTGVHNLVDGYFLFDWDSIEEEGNTEFQEKLFKEMTEILDEKV